MAKPYNGFKVGDRVQIVKPPLFRGAPHTTPKKVQIGVVATISKVGESEPSKWADVVEQNRHVVLRNDEVAGTWVEVDALELYTDEVEEQNLVAALASISEAAKHQEHVLIFKSIILADSTGKEIRVTVETASNQTKRVVLYDEEDMPLVTFDLDNWVNLQEAMELAFRQIDPLSTGKEK